MEKSNENRSTEEKSKSFSIEALLSDTRNSGSAYQSLTQVLRRYLQITCSNY